MSLDRDLGEVARGVRPFEVSLHRDQRCVGSGSQVRSSGDPHRADLSTGPVVCAMAGMTFLGPAHRSGAKGELIAARFAPFALVRRAEG